MGKTKIKSENKMKALLKGFIFVQVEHWLGFEWPICISTFECYAPDDYLQYYSNWIDRKHL